MIRKIALEQIIFVQSLPLFLLVVALLACQPRAVFTAEQEKEIEKRFASIGITAQYDAPLTYTTGEQGIGFVVTSPLSVASQPLIKKTIETFLLENKFTEFCFVGIFIPGDPSARIIDLDIGPQHQKPIWKGSGKLLMPAFHKAKH